jgi:hypothetical protein
LQLAGTSARQTERFVRSRFTPADYRAEGDQSWQQTILRPARHQAVALASGRVISWSDQNDLALLAQGL